MDKIKNPAKPYFIGITIVSPRVGTPAAKLVDNVTYDEKVKRFKELVSTLEVDINEKANSMVGKVFDVLVEEVSKKNKDNVIVMSMEEYNRNNLRKEVIKALKKSEQEIENGEGDQQGDLV